MTKRNLIAVVGVLAALVTAAYVKREELVLTSVALSTPKRSLDKQIALIEPGIEIFTPDAGPGPWPALLQFHGCSGFRRDWMTGWAAIANEAGFIVIAVDSNGPRGIDRERALKTVCAGKELIGQERAGDIAAAIEFARRRADVDAARIVIAGWSHGAWSTMDYLALEGASRAPASLDARPDATPLAGAILFYPYCGEGAWSRLSAWKQKPPTLAFVAGRDSVVSPQECRDAAAKLAREGVTVDLVDYPEADHAFDDATLLGGPYAYFYDAPSAADARRRVSAFLKSVAQK
ncbi:MAG: prolyl oligopeptidase family serine peptidase [Parvularculaceae bacterium]|nr:prolyl oligopeptidase family serine peptidase [Parvularculaceae bacterium]